MEWNRIKVGSRISDVITKRLTIIRTKARGSIPGRKEIVARDKGEHGRGTVLCRAEENCDAAEE